MARTVFETETISTQLHVKNKQRREWDNVSGLLCRQNSQRHPTIVYFSLHRRPEGEGNYLVARQRATLIALCIVRMAAVNMDAAVCAAVGGQVLMLIKWERVPACMCMCVTEPSACSCPHIGADVFLRVCHFAFLLRSNFHALAEYQPANEKDYISMLH